MLMSLSLLNVSFAGSEPDSSVIGEAATAVVDRVFGVKGEAANIDYHVVEFTKVSPTNSAVRSLFVPGWGQHFNRQRVKGSVLFLAFAASTFGALHLYNKSQNTFDDYNNRGVKDDPLYSDYEDQKTQSTLLGAGAIFIWAFSIFDAYKNAYNPLYTKNVTLDLAYSPDESSLRLNKRF